MSLGNWSDTGRARIDASRREMHATRAMRRRARHHEPRSPEERLQRFLEIERRAKKRARHTEPQR